VVNPDILGVNLNHISFSNLNPNLNPTHLPKQ